MKKQVILGLSMVLVAVLLVPAGGQAAVGRTFHALQVGFLDIMSGDGVDNIDPSIAYNTKDQEYLVVWSTLNNENTWSLWGRRVHFDGKMEAPFEIFTQNDRIAYNPVLAYNPDRNEYLLVFTYYVQMGPTGDHDIDGIIVSADGSKISELIKISDTTIQDEKNSSVVYSHELGGYFVVYDQVFNGVMRQIVGREVPGDFNPSTTTDLPDPAFVIASGNNQDRYEPDVAYHPDSGFMVVYTFSSAIARGVRGRLVPPDLLQGNVSEEYEIGTIMGGDATPSIAAGEDEYMVVYSTHTGASQSVVLGRRLALSGQPQGTAGEIILSDTEGEQLRRNPDIATQSGYGYMIVMEYFNPASSYDSDIYYNRLAFGADQAGTISSLDTSPNLQAVPSVACSDAGDCLVVYEHLLRIPPEGSIDIRGAYPGKNGAFLPLILLDQ